MKNSVILIVAFWLTFFMIFSVSAKETNTLIENRKDDAFLSNQLIYYGLDFSRFHLYNELKLDQGQRLKDIYIPVWTQKFGETYNDEKLSNLFNVDSIINKSLLFEKNQYNKIDPQKTVSATKNLLVADTIRKVVKDYSLSEKSGVGFAIIVEEFDKPKDIVSAVFTFFDISTKEVLFAYREYGWSDGIGMENHWRHGLINSMNEFMLREYYFSKNNAEKKLKKRSKKK